MYALERKHQGKWQQFALCNRRWLLDKVMKTFDHPENWRVVISPVSLYEPSERRRAA